MWFQIHICESGMTYVKRSFTRVKKNDICEFKINMCEFRFTYVKMKIIDALIFSHVWNFFSHMWIQINMCESKFTYVKMKMTYVKPCFTYVNWVSHVWYFRKGAFDALRACLPRKQHHNVISCSAIHLIHSGLLENSSYSMALRLWEKF